MKEPGPEKPGSRGSLRHLQLPNLPRSEATPVPRLWRRQRASDGQTVNICLVPQRDPEREDSRFLRGALHGRWHEGVHISAQDFQERGSSGSFAHVTSR